MLLHSISYILVSNSEVNWAATAGGVLRQRYAGRPVAVVSSTSRTRYAMSPRTSS
jgi:hypothetical protein